MVNSTDTHHLRLVARVRVLLVEDYADTREMYALYFQLKGLDVLQAADGLQGLLQARAAKPDAVVLDVSLPRLDGIELTRRLREDDATAAVPVIVLSAHTGDDYRRRALAAGASLALEKPCLPDDLLREILHLLEKAPSTAAAIPAAAG
jgi:DNA-binding response OmpR family regulator